MLAELEATMIANFNFKVKGMFKASGSRSYSYGKDFYSIGKTFYFMVGPIPVWVTVTATLGGKFTATTNGSAEGDIDIEGNYTYERGKRFPGWSTLGSGFTKKYKSNYSYNFHADLSLKPSLEGKLKVKVYSVLGPELIANPYLELKADVNGSSTVGATATWGIYAGLDVFFAIKSSILGKYLNYGPNKIYSYRNTIKQKTINLTNVNNISIENPNTKSPGAILNKTTYDTNPPSTGTSTTAYQNCMSTMTSYLGSGAAAYCKAHT